MNKKKKVDHVLSAGAFHLVVIGASVKAEQRILNIKNYWNELAVFFSGNEMQRHLFKSIVAVSLEHLIIQTNAMRIRGG